MIEQILPGTAIAVEAFADAEESTLFPEERRIVAKAVEGPRDDWRVFVILGAKY